MATNCKLIFGYTDHTGWWRETDCFYRHYDGYQEAIIPLLKEHKADITTMNSEAEYDGHKWEELENSYHGVTNPDYLYYIDTSDKNNLRCTVLQDDLHFYKNFGRGNYKVVAELVL